MASESVGTVLVSLFVESIQILRKTSLSVAAAVIVNFPLSTVREYLSGEIDCELGISVNGA